MTYAAQISDLQDGVCACVCVCMHVPKKSNREYCVLRALMMYAFGRAYGLPYKMATFHSIKGLLIRSIHYFVQKVSADFVPRLPRNVFLLMVTLKIHFFKGRNIFFFNVDCDIFYFAGHTKYYIFNVQLRPTMLTDTIFTKFI